MEVGIDHGSLADRNEEVEDRFLAFIEHARSVIKPETAPTNGLERGGVDGRESATPGWGWIASRVLRTCAAYSSGVTPAILLADLHQAWHDQHRSSLSKKRPECIKLLQRKHRRSKLPNTVTIDSIYEKNFLSLNSVLEAVIVDVFVLPGTNVYMLTLGDFWSSNTIDLYLHRRYYDLVHPPNGILKKGREVFLTGCHLRTAAVSFGHTRLLPTEYLVILLNEDQDDDAILLGAQFCSDTFVSISIDAVKTGVSYSLYARIESIGVLETMGSFKRKQITLVDSDGGKLKFLLWGEQILLANLFSVGSMVALDRPYVASSVENALHLEEELCLEYGSATQLYIVPYIQHEEQVYVALSGNSQRSRLVATIDPSQGPKVSQVTLPCDSQGLVDFADYPFRPFIIDLRHKMSGISLYGVITDIYRETNKAAVVFSMKLEDATGVAWIRLHFGESWSLRRITCGHTVFISGLTCSRSKSTRLDLSWFENDLEAYAVNLSMLPAMLNSSGLHKLSCLSNLSNGTTLTHICRVWLGQIEECQIEVRETHSRCGHFILKTVDGRPECSFCECSCACEVASTFLLQITLADDKAKVRAWCTGQTASELLQITPDEFYMLPEDEQLIYPSSLENEKFTVAIVNGQTRSNGLERRLPPGVNKIPWEITCASKS